MARNGTHCVIRKSLLARRLGCDKSYTWQRPGSGVLAKTVEH